jgi:hypothetical protein
MAKSFVLVLSLLSALGLLAGCTPADPAGQPTYSCTPETGGTPFPCYKVQRDEYDKLDALYAEAEAVYRRYLAEDERISRAGGVDEATPAMQETMTSTVAAQALETYRTFKRDRMRIEGGALRLSWIKRQPKKLRPGMAVAFLTCIDGSSARLVQAGSADLPVGFISGTVQLARDGETLKVALIDGDQVTSC